MQPFQQMSFGKALASVFSGCAVTVITPNRIGEYGGRILHVEPAHRIRAVSVSILGGLSQTLVTFIAGCAGLIYLRSIRSELPSNSINDLLTNQTFVISSFILCACLILLFWFENACCY